MREKSRYVGLLTSALLSAGAVGPVLAQAAAPPADAPPKAEAPLPAKPDDGPLLTPQIRPQGKAPEKAPERKAEPKSQPEPKRAQPAPSPKSEAEKKTPGGPPAADKSGKPPVRPGLAVVQPRTAAERDKALSDLYAYLAAAEDAKQAETVAASIERLWVTPGSDTITLLMQRALGAANAKNPELALKLLDAVVALAPDYAEGWNRRAYVHYTQNHLEQALGDLRRTLALDPSHFKALDGLIHILREIGRKKEALQAARRLIDINPYSDGTQALIDELARELEGRGI